MTHRRNLMRMAEALMASLWFAVTISLYQYTQSLLPSAVLAFVLTAVYTFLLAVYIERTSLGDT